MKNTKLYHTAKEQRPEVKQFVKFAIVGGSGLIVDYIVLNILRHVFQTSSQVAVTGGFVIAALSNFYWNRNWVYPQSRTVKKRKQLPQFLLINFVGLIINLTVVHFAEVPMTHLMTDLVKAIGLNRGGTFLGLNITKAIAAIIVMVWNFVVNRLVTFRGMTGTSALPVPDETVESVL
ncbi:MAG: GtrA family protein [Anaerolineae bacterium]|nr:GtrA family protein [Anaerolineae bacterium]